MNVVVTGELNFEQKAQVFILLLSSLACAARSTEVT
jgi:hypothetical protein